MDEALCLLSSLDIFPVELRRILTERKSECLHFNNSNLFSDLEDFYFGVSVT